MHYLITGGAGFLGSHLADRLLAEGARVTVLDDFSFGRQSNLAGARRYPGFACVRGSVCDRALVARCVADADVVVHFAAAIGVEHVSRRPLPALLGNVHGSLAVLRAAARHGRPVLLASS